MKPAIPTLQTPANISRVLKTLRDTPAQLDRLSGPLAPHALWTPLGSGERSFSEDLAHLSHCEAVIASQIYMALLTEEPVFADLHPERHWGKLLRYDTFEFADLLAHFKFRRTTLLRVLEALTEAQWARAIREEGKQRKESVYRLARTQALHEQHHLEDIEHKQRTLAGD